MQVTVKDIREFLSDLHDDVPVELDKDGWLEDEIQHKTPLELLRKRGLFHKMDQSKFGGGMVLIINN